MKLIISPSSSAAVASGSSTSLAVAQTAHGFSVGDVIKETSSANTYAKAQADSSANAEAVGIVTTVTDANNFTYTTHGIITAGVPTATAGTVYFLSPSSAGALTATEPTTAGQVSKPLVVILQSATTALFNNYRGLLVATATPSLSSGTYTPTLSNTTNVAASTARLCTYLQVGATVTVSGQFDIDPTAPASATLLGISLPVASAFTTAYQLGGTACATGIASQSAGIEADATNDRASVKFVSADITNQPMTFTFTYQVI